MAKMLGEMTAEEIIQLAKSFSNDEDKQIEMVKALSAADASYGRTTKEELSAATGGKSRRGTNARTVTMPTAPGENVGQIDDPDEIQNRFRDDYVDAEEYNKGEEEDDEDEDDKKKKSLKAKKSSEVEEEDEAPRTRKSNAAVTEEEYEMRHFNSIMAKGNERELREVIDSAPVIRALTEATAETSAATNVKIDDVAKSVNDVVRLTKSLVNKIEEQAEELEAMKAKFARNHNRMLEFVEKSLANVGEQMVKSVSATEEEDTAVAKSVSATPRVEMVRPTMNGAIAVFGGDNNRETVKKSNRLSGDYKTDRKMLVKALTAAGEAGERGATNMLAQVNFVPQGYTDGLHGIAAMMPDSWFEL